MRGLWISLLALALATTVQAAKYTNQKVKLGKAKCTCTFTINESARCSGKATCDKKCTGAGVVEVGSCSFTVKMRKGKGSISKCSCDVATTTMPPVPTGSGSGETPIPITGSGSGPMPPTGSGSGSGPMPPTGSGSGEVPVPITGGSGSGSGPMPPAGEGMQCSCKCQCPDGSGECDCDCNCPMTSTSVTCAAGFTKVCPMKDNMCPQDMEPMCPNGAMSRMAGGNYGQDADKGCQCVPDFLMAMVMPQPAGRMTAVDRAMTKATIKFGKKSCRCSYEINAKNCKRSKIVCDKKCSGKAMGVELGDWLVDLSSAKGKVKVLKCEKQEIVTAGPVPTGPGSGGNGGGEGSGSGNGEGGAGGSRCACVSKGMGGTGPTPPTGSGSGSEPMPPTGSGSGSEPMPPTGSGSGSEPMPPTGSGSGSEPMPPTGSGSGSGTSGQKVLPWFLGMTPMELCVETGTEVIFNKTGHNVVEMGTQSDYDGCTGFLGENATVGNNIDPFVWQADRDSVNYFACGVGTHCSAGGMKAKITVAPSCSKNVTVPWSWGMEPQVLCVETGSTVVIEKTGSGHNVNMLATQSEYESCSGFTDTVGNAVNPFLFHADTPGIFYFACGVGTHCETGNMKAMVTVAESCQ